jgi:hypothetical protein
MPTAALFLLAFTHLTAIYQSDITLIDGRSSRRPGHRRNPMSTATDNTARQQTGRTGYLASRRSPGWIQARIFFNVFRVILGVVLLASMPWSGRWALLGLIPLAWAAVAFPWLYRLQHGGQGKGAAPAAR